MVQFKLHVEAHRGPSHKVKGSRKWKHQEDDQEADDLQDSRSDCDGS
jgi:hypothetical protein